MSIHYMNRRVGMQGSQEFITMTVKAIGTVASAPQTLLSGMGRKHWSEMQMVTPPPPHMSRNRQCSTAEPGIGSCARL